MITKTESKGVQNGKELVRLAFKSTDDKPTTGIMNGSTGIEVNKGKQFVFDEESGEWTEIASSGGGGGGGGGGIITCDVVVKNNYRSSVVVKIPYYYNDALTGSSTSMITGLSSTYHNVALYNGSCKILTDDSRIFTVTSGSATASGNAAIVTGNCELAIS